MVNKIKNMSESLLEKAKSTDPYKYRTGEDVSKEEMELTLAWARNEITLSQAAKVLQYNNTKNYCLLYAVFAKSLKKYIQSLSVK